MPSLADEDDPVFREVLRGLERGDFSALEPFFVAESDSAAGRPRIVEWHAAGLFGAEPKALAEALTCACFLGRTGVADYLLIHGVDPTAGGGTGMNALHWAGNRGQLEAVRLLLRHKAPLETRNMYGGTVLGTTIWSMIDEKRRPDHLQIVEELLAAGARVEDAGYPTGHDDIDVVLRRHGAA